MRVLAKWAAGVEVGMIEKNVFQAQQEEKLDRGTVSNFLTAYTNVFNGSN